MVFRSLRALLRDTMNLLPAGEPSSSSSSGRGSDLASRGAMVRKRPAARSSAAEWAVQPDSKRPKQEEANGELAESLEALLSKIQHALSEGPRLSIAAARDSQVTMQRLIACLRAAPFGMWPEDCDWTRKQKLYSSIGAIDDLLSRIKEALKATDEECIADKCAVALLDQLIRSGYAYTIRDRSFLAESGIWMVVLDFLEEVQKGCYDSDIDVADYRKRALRTYMHLAEHASFYEDFSSTLWKKEGWPQSRRELNLQHFWECRSFVIVMVELQSAPWLTWQCQTPDQWEMFLADIEASLKLVAWFATLHMEQLLKHSQLRGKLSMYLDSLLDIVASYDDKFGTLVSANSRGWPLEGMIKISGLLVAKVMSAFEEGQDRVEEVMNLARFLNRFLQRMLTLQIPTCAHGQGSASDGSTFNMIPIDERQQDADWIEGLVDNIGIDEALHVDMFWSLFQKMVTMPLEEQRYRLECLTPLVSPYIAKFSEELRRNTVPPALSDLKTVVNAVLQDHATSLPPELLEEVSFYPCLLEFATKRAGIQATCERVRLQSSDSDPIRLVVPRDNVLDGVCSSLHLGDANARINVPLEIEFRAGYSDHNGTELVDEGEDQGGLRRQWLDRASRYFINSDLFMSPSEDAAHLEGEPGLKRSQRVAQGMIYVPSPESVCRCVQEDWKEQFELFGCVMGFAILYKETIPVHVGHNFLRAVFGLKIDTQDLLPLLENVDKTLHTKLKYILDGSYTAVGDTLQDVLEQSHLPSNFTDIASHCPELVSSTLLKEKGDQIPVTEENKQEFVSLLLHQVLISGVATQVECFRHGLHRVIPEDIVQRIAELMTVKEIELMVCGVDEIDVKDWQKYTQYENGYTADSQPIRWFWEVVHELSAQSRAALLSFATGSAQVPSGGFRFLQPELFTVQRVPVTDRYPEAHTCANMLDLPEYKSREELERRLRFAIEEAGDAFGRR